MSTSAQASEPSRPARPPPSGQAAVVSPTILIGITDCLGDDVRALFRFPNPVNEISARLVAAGVVIMSLVAIVFDVRWLTAVIAYGFVARVLTGPTLSPLGQLVTRVITPSLRRPAKLVPGPPKRFAQG